MAFWSPPANLPLRRRRSPKLVALGVLLALVGGLATASFYYVTVAPRKVLMAARVINPGATITRDDLAVVDVPGTADFETVSADLVEDVVGKVAVMGLSRGALLTAGSYGPAAFASGKTQVGLHLEIGRIPSREIPAGARLRLIRIGSGEEPGGPVTSAVLLSAPQETQDGSWFLSIEIDNEQAAETVAQLAAADRLVVVRDI